jgi:hypothetical protein
MNETPVRFVWREPAAAKDFRRGVCLHGHTLYSQECLAFLPRYLHQAPGISQMVRRYDGGVDYARAYWTPPLSPASALDLERRQIERLGLEPFVSLTDHDEIAASMALQVTAARYQAPVSVEWTVPYMRSILHLGIHNLPPGGARTWMAAMAAFTAAPQEAALPGLLSALSAIPDVLIVLNHPFWLEEGVRQDDHKSALRSLWSECLEWLHAFELNGTRPWRENEATIALGRDHGRPVISGGDRHACEPAACINLTNARSFAEFVREVREGHSHVLFLPQYREPMALRVLEACRDILRYYPEYPGRERWTDRIFYRGNDGVARPVSVVWKGRAPWTLNGAAALLQLAAGTKLRLAIRLLTLNNGEVLP